MAENNVDYSHFRYVHGTDAIPEDEFITEGTYKRAVGQGGNFVREGYGLGLGVLRVKGWVTFLSSTTPIDEEHVHVRWIFTAPKANGEDALVERGRLVLRRREPGHPHLGEQGLPAPPGADAVGAPDPRAPPVGPAVLLGLRRGHPHHHRGGRMTETSSDQGSTGQNRWVRQPPEPAPATSTPRLPSLEVVYRTDPAMLAAVLPPAAGARPTSPGSTPG